jgi:hypothetical protein
MPGMMRDAYFRCGPGKGRRSTRKRRGFRPMARSARPGAWPGARPARSEDQRRLAQQLVCHHARAPSPKGWPHIVKAYFFFKMYNYLSPITRVRRELSQRCRNETNPGRSRGCAAAAIRPLPPRTSMRMWALTRRARWALWTGVTQWDACSLTLLFPLRRAAV